MEEYELKQWIAEVKFLKAYYHYWLLRMYGPIPLISENLIISAGVETVQVKREPVDVCFDYIVQLLDEASPYLPVEHMNEYDARGRITRVILLAVTAKLSTDSASPLFNGNADYANFKYKEGPVLFT